MIAWALFLNDYVCIAMTIAIINTFYFFYNCSEVNYIRITTIAIGFYCSFLVLYYSYNIPYFFPKLSNFMSVVCLNCALSNEYLKKCSSHTILPMLLIAASGFSVLSFLIVLIPDSLYTLFSKKSLFYMALFIFLPYLILLAYNMLRKIYLHANERATM